MLENFETLKNKILSIVLILMLISTMFVLTGCGETTTEEGEESKTNIPVASDAINAENYGDYVDYSIDLNDDGDTTNDWKIFYNDGTYVYIIASEYLDNSLVPAESGIISDDRGVYWDTSEELLITSLENAQSRFLISGLSSIDESNTSYQAAASLLDTTVWADFVDTSCADYAIGSPTIEMWVASWNAKGYTTLYTAVDSTGYNIGKSTSPTYYNVEVDELEGYSDTLYFPDEDSDENNRVGYLLASPSGGSNLALGSVSVYGTVGARYVYVDWDAVRPVVSLKSSVQLTQNSDGVWEIN